MTGKTDSSSYYLVSAYYMLDIMLSTIQETFDLIFVAQRVEDLILSRLLSVK